MSAAQSHSEVRQKATLAKTAQRRLALLSTEAKNAALLHMADALVTQTQALITANEEDLRRGEEAGLTKALLDRLSLDDARVKAMADGLRQVAQLPDPVGESLERFRPPQGLDVHKVRVPLGVIGMIYEARPNVTVDAVGLCLKTGNAVVLRGGSAALSSNVRIVEVLHDALKETEVPVDAVQLIHSADRSSVDELLTLNGLLDVVIPRGGAGLIQNVVQNATVPVIETGAGICHTYLDASAEPAMAADVALNAKVQRPSVCNAMETLLVHDTFAREHLPSLAGRFREAGVTLRGCEGARALVPWMDAATEEDWRTEYNDYVLSVKVVGSVDDAIMHIQQYGTMHSESIVAKDPDAATRFLQQVDAAAVYHNASTRFTDGFQFGFGAEIGISTQKLHARGPMGLPALTSTKYLIYGNGQTR